MPKTNKFLIHCEEAFYKACSLDVRVLKPGNVSFQSPGHGMHAMQFINSLKVVTPIIFNRDKTIGEKIEYSIDASFEIAKCNTNLGIVLLCAPIIEALILITKDFSEHEIYRRNIFDNLQKYIKKILLNTTVNDTSAVFRAIKKANPGGLGVSDIADVRIDPEISLLNAMGAGAQKDFIAKQYCVFFKDIFDQRILKATNSSVSQSKKILEKVDCKNNLEKFVQKIYFSWLVEHQDTHIVRKYGIKSAQTIKNEAFSLLLERNSDQIDSKLKSFNIVLPSEKQLLYWDYSLKKRNINPGTSADLTVCTLFLAYVLMPNLKYF